MSLKVKRVYLPAAATDGQRVLVDRLWPRGLRKEAAHIDEWRRELAPSTELRKWFGHEAAKWPEFCRRYAAELRAQAGIAGELAARAKTETVTLLFGAKDEEHNNAVALCEWLGQSAAGDAGATTRARAAPRTGLQTRRRRSRRAVA